MQRMTLHDLTRGTFGLVVVLALGAAVFRVATAPERIKERRETARSVCLSSGGQWVKVQRDEVCQRDTPTLRF
jgi:hypothetical protein